MSARRRSTSAATLVLMVQAHVSVRVPLKHQLQFWFAHTQRTKQKASSAAASGRPKVTILDVADRASPQQIGGLAIVSATSRPSSIDHGVDKYCHVRLCSTRQRRFFHAVNERCASRVFGGGVSVRCVAGSPWFQVM